MGNIGEKSSLNDLKLHDFDISHSYDSTEKIGDIFVGNRFASLLKRAGTFAPVKKYSEDTPKPEIQTLVKKDLKLTDDEAFLLEALLRFLKDKLNPSSCLNILLFICPYVPSYPDISESLRKLLMDRCKDPEGTCKYALEKLDEFCDYIKTKIDNIDASNTNCADYTQKCSYLVICKNGLDISCKKLKEKCMLLQNNTEDKTDDTTKYKTQKGPYNSQVIIDGTTLRVEIASYTHSKVLYGTKCYKDKSHTKCALTNTLISTCTPIMRETYSTDPYSEVDEISPQTECSVTLTLTNKLGETFMKTATYTTITGYIHDKDRDKGYGVQTNKNQKLILFHMILGIITGIWIIV
ncbi:hypothetical protein T552_03426 [Pneumocystis carinii B80]|uniref:Uncharacterized protein n=2 Tax=Pneumocystis carinii TaxID=4754 RepID=A0A0W4ZBD0_PNEC8|nr:hypothetical protein T552_03426 [Pneumocystis carinii B80]KTW25566.1 hypothetical protein T552_03426 [Pneumocystis carinii B80]